MAFINGNPFWGGAEKWHVGAAAYLRNKGHETHFFASGGEVARRARESRLPVSLMSFSSDVDGATILRLFLALRRFRPDAAIFNSERDLRLGGAAARMARVKTRVHRKGISGVKNNARYRWTYRNLKTHTLCVAQAVKDEIAALGWAPEDSLKVIHSGVDVEKFNPEGSANLRAEIGAGHDDIVIGAVARLSSIKGFEYLIEAFHRISGRFPGARLLLVGTGRLEDDLKRQAGALGLEKRAFFAGFREDAPDALRSIDIVAHPSVHTEGLPNSLLEAMACGKPALATPIAGIPEALVDGKTGLLVPPRDADALAEALATLISDPQRRARMGRKARERAKEKFNLPDKMAELENWLTTIT